ncbi:MAG: 4a-hydroxytetrahydrobiopterin dehydratase [Methanomicrobiales archaeon]|nr:4a-hydroxytetrahydrobiopterin dehydratase [Methanomicrobiales archaeon]MDI6876720.1 4a-hydroxytetrahydrobiopterin dehydratase [Methanomicrobiales archaeon]
MALETERCTPPDGSVPPLTRKEVLALLREVPGWALRDGYLFRSFAFPDFQEALRFVKELALLALEEGHYPDISVRQGRIVDVSWYTYTCGGLTRNDFILAAKMNREIPR